MRFGVLGPLAVWDDRGDEVAVPERKVRALLADLLVHDGGPVSADRLVQGLWGDRPPGSPAGALQAKVSQLRRVLGRDAVVHQAAGYRLRLDGGAEAVDAGRFLALAGRARVAEDPHTRAALLTEALGLWRGPAYADFADEEFALGAAQGLAEQRLSVREEQIEARLDAGDHLLLVGELAELVRGNPLRERLRGAQIRALYLAGRQGEALAAYEDLRARLADELGVDPSPALAGLHRAVLLQDPALDVMARRSSGPAVAAADSAGAAVTAGAARVDGAAEAVSGAPGTLDGIPVLAATSRGTPTERAAAPAGHSAAPGPSLDVPVCAAPPSRVPSNLAVPLTPLVGRDEALAEVSRLLGEARLVTLTGAGGVGKTRLAVAAAARLADGPPEQLPDGAWLVELSGVRAGGVADLVQRVAATLGVTDAGPPALPGGGPGAPSAPSPAHRLLVALRDRRALLVLDNCEHVVDAAAELAAMVLRTAAGVRVLATSQEPLGVAGETVYPVEPLGAEAAERLFTGLAAARDPGFPRDPAAADPADRDAVAEICRRLDGIPLALELAATRVRGLGVRGLADRLGDRFRLLSTGRRDLPARQQTLRAVIDWSWELLSAPERIVLRRLAVHRDGCDLEAAEAVCAGEGVAGEEVPDLVARLVDRSLVFVTRGPTGRRYHLLESVTAYAVERLHEMADFAAVEERHLAYYLALAEQAEPRLRGDGQRHWLARLDAESANLRAALDAAVRRAAAGPDRSAVRLATALSWWWLLRGRLTEAHDALIAVRAADAEPEPELALLHRAFALLNGVLVEPEDAAAAAEGVADPVRRGRALWLCGYGWFTVGETGTANELGTAALELFTAADDRWGTAAALGLRATLALARGDLAGLSRDGLRSAELFRELGDRWGELQTVSALAVLAEIRGEYGEASRRQREGLELAGELGLLAEVSARLSGLGRLALLAGDWEGARDLHERARRIAAEQGYKYGEIHAEMGLALGARRSGDLDAARDRLLRLRDGYADVSSEAGDHLVHAELGFVAELRHDRAGAAEQHLLGLAVACSLAEPRALALSLEGLAGAAVLAGDEPGARCAAQLLGAADAARRQVGAPLPPAERGDVDRITAAAQAVVGEARFAEDFAHGARLDVRDAIRRARSTFGLPAHG